MNADKILPILCRYLKDTDNRLLAKYCDTQLFLCTIDIVINFYMNYSFC